jgi:hypothetical protein
MTNDVNDDFLTHRCSPDGSINPPNIRSKDKVKSCVPEINHSGNSGKINNVYGFLWGIHNR